MFLFTPTRLLFRYELMKMCWAEPTQRPSLRELRIMLLHLRSSKDQSDTAAFDERWNQLMPRHRSDNYAADPFSGGAITYHLETSPLSDHPEQVVIASGNNVHGLQSSRLTGFAHIRPTSFESDLSDLNSSMRALAGSRQMSLRSMSGSRTGTPDSPSTRWGGFSELGSPVNDQSFSAEMNATACVRGPPPTGRFTLSLEGDEGRYWMNGGNSFSAWGGVTHLESGDRVEGDCDVGSGDRRSEVHAEVHMGNRVGELSEDVSINHEHIGESVNNGQQTVRICEPVEGEERLNTHKHVVGDCEQDSTLKFTNNSRNNVSSSENGGKRHTDGAFTNTPITGASMVDSASVNINSDSGASSFGEQLHDGTEFTSFNQSFTENSRENTSPTKETMVDLLPVTTAEDLSNTGHQDLGVARLSRTLQVATEMKRFAAGEELIGDGTDFGEYYLQNHASASPAGIH